VSATIVDEANRTNLEKTIFLNGSQFHGRAADYTLDLPIATLEAGAHLLTLEATLGQRTIRRTARFIVR